MGNDALMTVSRASERARNRGRSLRSPAPRPHAHWPGCRPPCRPPPLQTSAGWVTPRLTWTSTPPPTGSCPPTACRPRCGAVWCGGGGAPTRLGRVQPAAVCDGRPTTTLPLRGPLHPLRRPLRRPCLPAHLVRPARPACPRPHRWRRSGSPGTTSRGAGTWPRTPGAARSTPASLRCATTPRRSSCWRCGATSCRTPSACKSGCAGGGRWCWGGGGWVGGGGGGPAARQGAGVGGGGGGGGASKDPRSQLAPRSPCPAAGLPERPEPLTCLCTAPPYRRPPPT